MKVATAMLAAALLSGCTTYPPPGATPSSPSAASTLPRDAGPAERATHGAIQRIEALEGEVNALIGLFPDAMDEARAIDQRRPDGPLAGVPILIKDNIEARGSLATTAGSLALKDNVTGRDAPMIARLRDAGAVILGKTNLSEWANFRSEQSISGWSAVGGQTRNPWALDRNPCGSSSGSGAAVAAGMVDIAIGTETNGSITCPASMNGIVGFKPSVGIVSRTHIVPISASQDTAGPMTRSVLQAAQVMDAIAGSDPADPATAEADQRKPGFVAALDGASLQGVRLGVMRFADNFQTGVAWDQALQQLRDAGAILVDIEESGVENVGGQEYLVLLTEFKAGLNDYLASTPATNPHRSLADLIAFNKADPVELALFDQSIFEKAEATKGLDDPEYLAAKEAAFKRSGPEGIDRLLKEHDVVALIGPTVSPAFLIDPVHGDSWNGGGAGYLAARSGYPHLTVPMGLVDGLPVGLSFIGTKWDDAAILALGHAYEQLRGPFPDALLLGSVDEGPIIAPLLNRQN
ncbi:amidase [Sphingomicrobium flavum]|uniref:amidase n=1 Tax=Sphingomicrobium flavum TaxID=1229164 RepID=UPI0021AE2356|nr:amidase [Sphingomicrobium flavum]